MNLQKQDGFDVESAVQNGIKALTARFNTKSPRILSGTKREKLLFTYGKDPVSKVLGRTTATVICQAWHGTIVTLPLLLHDGIGWLVDGMATIAYGSNYPDPGQKGRVIDIEISPLNRKGLVSADGTHTILKKENLGRYAGTRRRRR